MVYPIWTGPSKPETELHRLPGLIWQNLSGTGFMECLNEPSRSSCMIRFRVRPSFGSSHHFNIWFGLEQNSTLSIGGLYLEIHGGWGHRVESVLTDSSKPIFLAIKCWVNE